MVSEGYQEYYEQNHPKLHKINSSANRNKDKDKRVNNRKENSHRREREVTDPEYYFNEQQSKIRKIEKERERLQREK